jgi:hypothetical protein
VVEIGGGGGAEAGVGVDVAAAAAWGRRGSAWRGRVVSLKVDRSYWNLWMTDGVHLKIEV